jgi:hypothetical protein
MNVHKSTVLGAKVSLSRNVGEDAVFMWNRTGRSIVEVSWGFLDDGLIRPQLIHIKSFTNVPIFSSALDTTAIRYKGRVSWVGDLGAGHAWFKITNLTIGDTNQYAARILIGNIKTISTIYLTVTGKLKNNPDVLFNMFDLFGPNSSN